MTRRRSTAGAESEHEVATPRRGRSRAAIETDSEVEGATPVPGELGKLKVKELQARLGELGMDTKGRKAELVARLQAALAGSPAENNEEEQTEAPKSPERSRSPAKPKAVTKLFESPSREQSAVDNEKANDEEILTTSDQEPSVPVKDRSRSPNKSRSPAKGLERQASPEPAPSPVNEPVSPAKPSSPTLESSVQDRSRSPDRMQLGSPPKGRDLSPIKQRGLSPSKISAVQQRSPSPEPREDRSRGRSVSPSTKAMGTDQEDKSPKHGRKHWRDRSQSRSASPKKQRRSRSRSASRSDSDTEMQGSPPNATFTIRIDNFVRPLRIDEVRELLSKYGNVVSLTMDKKKTHALAKFESKSESSAALRALQGIVFQPESGKTLAVSFTDLDPEAIADQNDGGSGGNVAIPPPETETTTLDELFKKTKAMPSLYWLPVQPPAKK